MKIEVYVTVDKDGNEGDREFRLFHEAQAAAGSTHAVIARTYEYNDSELVWTPNGDGTWPPAQEGDADA